MNRPEFVRQLPDPTAEGIRRQSPYFEPADPIELLPQPVNFKIIKLRAERDDAMARRKRLYDAAQDKLARVRAIEATIADRLDRERRADDDPIVVAEREMLTRAKLEHKGLMAEYSAAAADTAPLAQIVRRAEEFAAKVAGRKVATIEPVTPHIGRTETIEAAVEKVRRGIEKAADAEASARYAPLSSSAAKAIARDAIEKLAKAPNVMDTIEGGNPFGLPAKAYTDHVPFAQREHADIAGFLIWALKPAIVRAIESEIDESADDESALDDAERAERIAAAKAERLRLEREEESLILMAGERGQRVERRPDVDLRALLGLADSVPGIEAA